MTYTRIRLRITISMYKNDVLVKRSTLAIKSRILKLAQETLWDKAIVKVNYGNDLDNTKVCYSQDDVKWAVSAFTEKPLLDHINGGHW